LTLVDDSIAHAGHVVFLLTRSSDYIWYKGGDRAVECRDGPTFVEYLAAYRTEIQSIVKRESLVEVQRRLHRNVSAGQQTLTR
jgi:hypothetical protein